MLYSGWEVRKWGQGSRGSRGQGGGGAEEDVPGDSATYLVGGIMAANHRILLLSDLERQNILWSVPKSNWERRSRLKERKSVRNLLDVVAQPACNPAASEWKIAIAKRLRPCLFWSVGAVLRERVGLFQWWCPQLRTDSH